MQTLNASEQYLQTTVMTASPAKLRLMLIERGVGLVSMIKEARRKNPDVLVDQWTIRLRDILGELLQGVSRNAGDLALQVSDLYVFLIQELTYAEQEPGIERMESIGRILEIERETWDQVCQLQVIHGGGQRTSPHFGTAQPASSTPSSATSFPSLNLQG